MLTKHASPLPAQQEQMKQAIGKRQELIQQLDACRKELELKDAALHEAWEQVSASQQSSCCCCTFIKQVAAVVGQLPSPAADP
jgi:uncharacterized protein (DUF3084 family)